MMFRSLAYLAFASWVGAAWGQAPQTTFEQLIGRMSSYCIAAMADGSKAPEVRLSTCEAGLASVERMGASAGAISPKERNLYNTLRGTLYASIAASQGKIAGAQTAQVCASVEKGWAAVSQINPADSPEDQQKSIVTIREATIATTRACRSDNSAPAGAPPLP
jgi:hypothetical protein